MTTPPPPTVLLCARVQYGIYCLAPLWLGQCPKCGDKNAGVAYVRKDEA